MNSDLENRKNRILKKIGPFQQRKGPTVKSIVGD